MKHKAQDHGPTAIEDKVDSNYNAYKSVTDANLSMPLASI